MILSIHVNELIMGHVNEALSLTVIAIETAAVQFQQDIAIFIAMHMTWTENVLQKLNKN